MALPELQLDREQFLAQYWQQKPLLIRGALPGFREPIDADELAGLAMEDGVESRIVSEAGGTWALSHGPFEEADFHRDGPWTLLVQAADHDVAEVGALRRLVDFLPSWRVDDVMVSYAVDGGSVGPHYDNYDVFLLQGSGRRSWKLGQFCDGDSALLPHPELRILEHFDCRQEYLLEPGDMLYVPPGIAHWGVARGECTTYSIGFRAPRVNDMVSRWIDQLLEQLDDEAFYRDIRPDPVTRPGEIRSADLHRAMSQIQAALDQASGNRWFGELVTEPRYFPAGDEDELAEALAILDDGPRRVELSPEAKLAWEQREDGIAVYANGDSRIFSAAVMSDLERLCGDWVLADAELANALADEQRRQLLQYLLQTECIYVE